MKKRRKEGRKKEEKINKESVRERDE